MSLLNTAAVLTQTEIKKEKGIVLKGGVIPYSSSKLICVRCGKSLSVKPVSETEDGQYMCGRCSPEAKHCSLYGVLAEHIQFSCTFIGCSSKLDWGQVEEHEKNCYYRDISCPLPDCSENYQLSSHTTHFKKSHRLYKKSYCSGNFNLTNSIPHVNLICIAYEDVIYIVFIKIFSDSEKRGKYTCQFGLLHMARSIEYSWNLHCKVKIIVSPDIAIIKTIGCSNYMQYSERTHCLRCLYDVCDKPDHVNMGTTLFTNVLAFETGYDESLSYAIQINEKSLNLKCTKCPKSFGDIIYMCHICGESFCSDHYQKWIARPKQSKCPCCEATLSNCARNYSLEKIVRAYRQSL